MASTALGSTFSNSWVTESLATTPLISVLMAVCRSGTKPVTAPSFPTIWSCELLPLCEPAAALRGRMAIIAQMTATTLRQTKTRFFIHASPFTSERRTAKTLILAKIFTADSYRDRPTGHQQSGRLCLVCEVWEILH